MRFIHVVAVAGTAAALLGAPSAHADTGVKGYASCVGGDTKPPPPDVAAEDWFPSLRVMQVDLDSGDSPEQVVQILVGMGVNPNDAATRVRCYVANQPRGSGY